LVGEVALCGREDGHIGFWWGNLRQRNLVEDSGLDGRIILSLIFRWCVVGAWTGLIWLRIGTTFGIHKMLRSS